MSLCRFEDNKIECMMPDERDGFCIPHWRLKLGHEPTRAGLGDDEGREVSSYCRRCRGILGDHGVDDVCKAKLLNFVVLDSRKALEELMQRLTGGVNMNEVFGATVCEGDDNEDSPNSESYLPGEDAQRVLAEMLQMIPPCPDCSKQICVEWLMRYFKWIMTAMLGPSGFMSMFIACLEREGGSIEFTREEIINAGKVLKVENEVKFDNSATRAIIRERSDDVPTDGEESDHYWPDLIS